MDNASTDCVHATMSPSLLAAYAAKLTPPATCRPAKRDAVCAACGQVTPKDSLVADFKPGSGFTDCAALAAPQSAIICWACKAIWTKDFLMVYAKSVITPDGFFKFGSNAAIASFFLSPPAPPFTVVYSTAQQQHLIWRSPVNLSNERFAIRFGTRIFTVRHAAIMRAVAAMRKIFAAADAVKIKHATTPWPGANRELEFVDAPLDKRIEPLRAELTEEFAALESLNPAEAFAVAAIGYSGLTKPEPLVRSLPAMPNPTSPN